MRQWHAFSRCRPPTSAPLCLWRRPAWSSTLARVSRDSRFPPTARTSVRRWWCSVALRRSGLAMRLYSNRTLLTAAQEMSDCVILLKWQCQPSPDNRWALGFVNVSLYFTYLPRSFLWPDIRTNEGNIFIGYCSQWLDYKDHSIA